MKGLGCVKVIDDADFSSLGFPDPVPVLKKTNKAPLALILQPTRELAVQVKDHLQVAAAYTDITVCYYSTFNREQFSRKIGIVFQICVINEKMITQEIIFLGKV